MDSYVFAIILIIAIIIIVCNIKCGLIFLIPALVFLNSRNKLVLGGSHPKNKHGLINEFKVYSQHGEDGIIDSIFKLIPVSNKFYVEFGVEDGKECNTRYLRESKGWNGIMMDGGFEDLSIGLHKEFITRENIKELFIKYKVPKEFDLLSIDIDGNDYYVWEEICSDYSPRVVVIEYNSKFRPPDDRVIKYNATHMWRKLSTYFGASMQALYRLGVSLKYTLVTSDKQGVNLFFVRDDIFNKYLKNKFPDAGFPTKIFKSYKFHSKWDMTLKKDEEWIYFYEDRVPVVKYTIGEKNPIYPYDYTYKINFPATDNGIMRYALNNGYLFEKYTTMFINSYIPKDGVFIDIGANVGCISIPVSNMVPEGHVVSFECFKSTYNILSDNIRNNERSNITAINKAVGHKNTITTLDSSVQKFEDFKLTTYTGNLQDNIGGVRLGLAGPTVELVSLDSWFESSGLTRVDVIKIDIEGAEPLAIGGAKKIINKFKPIIIFEKNAYTITENMRSALELKPEDDIDIIAFAISIGYTKKIYIPKDNIALLCDFHIAQLTDPKVIITPFEEISPYKIESFEMSRSYA